MVIHSSYLQIVNLIYFWLSRPDTEMVLKMAVDCGSDNCNSSRGCYV